MDSNDKVNSNREVDTLTKVLMKRADGVDIAYKHGEYLSKYMVSLVHYVQEKSTAELEHAERTSKLINSCSLSSFLTTYQFLPGIDLIIKALSKDVTQHARVRSTWMVLQTHEFVEVKF